MTKELSEKRKMPPFFDKITENWAHKYRFTLQKGIKNSKSKNNFLFLKNMMSQLSNTFNRPHICKIGKITLRGIGPPKNHETLHVIFFN